MSEKNKYIKVPAIFFDKEQSDLMGKDVYNTYQANINTDLIISWYGYMHENELGEEKEFVKLICAGQNFTVPLTSIEIEKIITQ